MQHFGAEGFCCCGELADGLLIDLDAVPVKYEGWMEQSCYFESQGKNAV